MKQFLIVLKFELNNYLKNKSFLLTTGLLAILLAGVVIIPTLIPGFLNDSKESDAAVVKVTKEEETCYGIYVKEDRIPALDEFLKLLSYDWTQYDDPQTLRKEVSKGNLEGGFIVEDPLSVTYVVYDLSFKDQMEEIFSQALTRHLKQQYLLAQGLTPEEILESESFSVQMTQEVLGKNGISSYAYTYVLVFVVYFLIILYGQMIATSVTTEKSNRAIEILVTSVNSNSLIFGKVLAGGIAGILQTVVILGSGFGAYHAVRDSWGGLLDFLFHIKKEVWVVYILFALLSYFLYAFIYGMLGALVSKTEDISKSSTPITIVYVISFLIAMTGMTNSEGTLMKVASYIPFTSGNAMFIRYSMGSVALYKVMISLFLLLASCIAVGILGARIFRMATLHYGNPMKFTTAVRKLFSEKES